MRSELARKDLLEIWHHISDFNLAAADRILGEIGAKCDMLAEMPHVGHARPDFHADLRCSVAGSYVIFYREIEGGIEVVRVLHGRRNFDAIDFDPLFE
ncbi:MAG TPA: type II toxin-antitoxin system RelE/ParE family toxin [Planctomycetaceae bacterium]|nr:type II toxin-antitoxin system RelE/ParE family toxin [Planctomycetaceae bacterium]